MCAERVKRRRVVARSVEKIDSGAGGV